MFGRQGVVVGVGLALAFVATKGQAEKPGAAASDAGASDPADASAPALTSELVCPRSDDLKATAGTNASQYLSALRHYGQEYEGTVKDGGPRSDAKSLDECLKDVPAKETLARALQMRLRAEPTIAYSFTRGGRPWQIEYGVASDEDVPASDSPLGAGSELRLAWRLEVRAKSGCTPSFCIETTTAVAKFDDLSRIELKRVSLTAAALERFPPFLDRDPLVVLPAPDAIVVSAANGIDLRTETKGESANSGSCPRPTFERESAVTLPLPEAGSERDCIFALLSALRCLTSGAPESDCLEKAIPANACAAPPPQAGATGR